MLARLARARIRDRVRLVRLGEHKDVSDLHVADPDAFMARWAAAVACAEPWETFAARQLAATTDAAWSQCEDLAREPDILHKLDESLDARGVVGERRAARLVFLAATGAACSTAPCRSPSKDPHPAGSRMSCNRCSSTARLSPTTR